MLIGCTSTLTFARSLTHHCIHLFLLHPPFACFSCLRKFMSRRQLGSCRTTQQTHHKGHWFSSRCQGPCGALVLMPLVCGGGCRCAWGWGSDPHSLETHASHPQPHSRPWHRRLWLCLHGCCQPQRPCVCCAEPWCAALAACSDPVMHVHV
jgi:hypothetical protein